MEHGTPDFATVDLDATHTLRHGRLPEELLPDGPAFGTLWASHPAERHEIHIHGRTVRTPRWQQAYGRDYRFSGQTYAALPVPHSLAPLRDWCRRTVDARLNGLLLNWYDGSLGHYIGPHRDSTRHLVAGSPIVTVSLGESRVFRLRPVGGKGFVDVPVDAGSVVVLPWDTNLAWKHEIPRSKRHAGRRISVTLRAFADD